MSKTIFCAEDSPMQQDLLRAALAASEVELHFFADGVEMYRAVMESPPDMLILDIILPSLNGVAICRLVKHHGDYERIPVLVTSSIIDADIRERVHKAGANMFLPKPYKPDAMADAVANLLPT